MCNKSNFNNVMSELAKYKAMLTEVKTEVDRLQNELIEYMSNQNIETLQGVEHKASYKEIVTNRLDTKALKLDNPELVDKYTKSNKSMRFNFS